MKGVMKSEILLTILILITVCLINQFTYAKYSSGTGEPNDPYQIATADDLMLLGESPEDYDKHFILTADINLDPNLPGHKVFDGAVIAPDTNDVESGFQGNPFNGIFDGNGHMISHLTIEGRNYLGLLGQLKSGAVVKNLGIVDVNIASSGGLAGGLVGSNGGRNTQGGSVTDCHSTGLISGNYGVGGLIGLNSGSISISYSTGTVIGTNKVRDLVNIGSFTGVLTIPNGVGGLVGINFGTIGDCYSSGTVSGKIEAGGLVGSNSGSIFESYSNTSTRGEERVGGLVGANRGGSTEVGSTLGRIEAEVTNCYSMGTVRGYKSVGGFVGSNGYVIHITPEIPVPIIPIPEIPIRIYEDGRISNCYSTGKVFGSYSTGGLVGNNGGGHGITTASFWDIDTSGLIGSCGGVDKTTSEMQTTNTFLEGGWDFVGETENGTEDIWWINEGQGYPRLWWERSNGDMVFIVVDDFESYNDLDEEEAGSNLIWNTWIDGFDNPEINGSIVGHLPSGPMSPIMEWAIVHSGYQSMPFSYNNAVGKSEATANIDNLEIGLDWTVEGVRVLSLWFRGSLDNAVEPMYLALANTGGSTAEVYHENPNAIQIDIWMEWRIALQEFAEQGVDLTNVNSITLGFGNRDNPQPGGSGVMYLDDICLYRPDAEPVQ